MRYQSTRGGVRGVSFVDSLLMGLASDGGLLVPESIPDVSSDLEGLRGLDFISLAKRVLPLFVDDIPEDTLNNLIDRAYARFDHPDVIGERVLDDVLIMELFHGPTLAFKDVALQLLGQLFSHVLSDRGERLKILGATSGDTGSAAIEAVRGQPNIEIYILYPNNKVSPLQERQMTTVPDENVHCVAVEGSFDDCQALMKTVFADAEFKAAHSLGAVNSVNWARVMAQIIYYGYASLRAPAPPAFVVPTGNFGNVFAAYLAWRMGFPINRLIVATNENDILARFFATGEYARGEVHFTLSPAMDIQVASNFERYLYYYFQGDTRRLCAFMDDFATHGRASLGSAPDDDVFTATAVDRLQTLGAIKAVYNKYGYVLDPHTAVGYAAAASVEVDSPVIVAATAHPAKFTEAVTSAIGDAAPGHPTLDALESLPERKTIIEADVSAVRDLLAG